MMTTDKQKADFVFRSYISVIKDCSAKTANDKDNQIAERFSQCAYNEAYSVKLEFDNYLKDIV